MTLQCIVNVCICATGAARIEENDCLPIDSPECGGLYDPVEAFKRELKGESE